MSNKRPVSQTATFIRPSGLHTPLFGHISPGQAQALLGCPELSVYSTPTGEAIYVKDSFDGEDVRTFNPYATSLYSSRPNGSPIFGSVIVEGCWEPGPDERSVRSNPRTFPLPAKGPIAS